METLNVLIVDDEPGMRMGVQRALERFVVPLPDIETQVGFRLQSAADGVTARRWLAETDVDLMLLDHKLPDMTGLDILANLDSTRHANLLTIMITAYASLETAVTAIKCGAYDFLAKPFTPAELRETVTKGARALVMARKARELASERRRVRFEFIRVLAHELQSPLGAVQGYLEILRDGALAGDPAAARTMIDRSLLRTEQMSKLIVDLLDMTSIESGRMERSIEPVDLRAVAAAALENMAPDAARRGILLTPITATPAVQLPAVRTEMTMLLNNLISNAVKYNRDGGRVEVDLEDLGDRVRIEVHDSGIGMTAEETVKLFQEFSRIRNDHTRHILGSGLGLSIVKKIAALYDGEVSAKSVPEHGSDFCVILNKKTAPQPEATGSQSPAPEFNIGEKVARKPL